jgi:NAD(P)-dependent dehydrogenase (short-subunit alcohol dehydrogenase family)
MAATEGFPVETFLKQVPMKRIAQPEEIGRIVAVLLSDDASYMTGEIVRVDGGLRA